jgi:hypothetical protein
LPRALVACAMIAHPGASVCSGERVVAPERVILLSYRRRYKYSVAMFESAVRRVALRSAFWLTCGLILASLQAATRHRTPREGVSPSSYCPERQRSACTLIEGYVPVRCMPITEIHLEVSQVYVLKRVSFFVQPCEYTIVISSKRASHRSSPRRHPVLNSRSPLSDTKWHICPESFF